MAQLQVPVSVVVPTWNRAELLPRALESVLAQTRPATEVLVVDDGSTDATRHRIQQAFPQVRYLHQPHRGVSAARNRGVAAARGDWIAFLDADDEWCPQKLERQLEALAREPGYRICHSNEIWIRNGRRVNPGKRHAKTGGHIFHRCLSLCAISPSSVLLEKRLFEEVGGFDESLPVCEDYDLWLRICARHRVLYVDRPLVIKYGGHRDQLSRRYWGLDRFRIVALENVLAKAELAPAQRQAALQTLLQKMDIYLRGARRRGRWAEVRECERRRAVYERQWQSRDARAQGERVWRWTEPP